ncbi:unnamed protein product [Rhizophagus irregularis]|uniref:Uncharacterized protein n=1 Tax=Rhizophagus irregularis TaxID=588596 RepID=A0A2N1NAT2_9GLOM|nr:hypothetical protein RhiirC2_849493 [Rhizophagus irregularis]CAB4382022.1 unnamed protein product [Rhizophagus irregularis]CAB5352474.1 unnamed protein product [Rhizophagus irregularis]
MSNQYLKTFKTAQESKTLFGGTPKQEHKINELEKNENKAGPAAASSGQEKAPSSSQPLEAQTHDSDGGKTFLPIPNDQVHDFSLETRDSRLKNSGLSSPPNQNARITSILRDPQTYDNSDGHQTHDGRSSATIPNPQSHDGRSSATISTPQSHDGRSFATIPIPQSHNGMPSNYYARIPSILNGPQTHSLSHYPSNYYVRISSILNGPPTLPSLQWVLNNPNESNDDILPPIYNNPTPQQIHLRTLEPDHEPDVPKLQFQL